MRHVYLIARREYLSYVATIGFWVSLAMIPVFLLLGMMLPAFLDRASPTRNFVVIDTSARFEQVIRDVIDERRQEQIERLIDKLILVDGETGPLIEAKAALDDFPGEEKIAELLGSRYAAALDGLRRDFRMVKAPEQTASALRPWLLGEKQLDTPRGPESLHAAVFIDIKPDNEVEIQYWSANINEGKLLNMVRDAVRNKMRMDGFTNAGIERSLVKQISQLTPEVISMSPEKAEDDAKVTAKDRLPYIMAVMFGFLLWSVVFSVANMLLTSVIEEKSNKILDSLLCAAPLRAILMGKLFGVAAVSFTLIIGWALAGWVSAMLAGSVIEVSEGHKFTSLIASAGDLKLLIPFFAYFVFGYLMFGSIFLALGSLCETLQEAQTLMTPLIFLLMVPVIALMFAMQDPESPVLAVLSWIPLFTPYIMMARLPTDPPMIEIIGTALVMLATTALILLAAGKVFQAGVMHQAGSDYFKKMLGKYMPGRKASKTNPKTGA